MLFDPPLAGIIPSVLIFFVMAIFYRNFYYKQSSGRFCYMFVGFAWRYPEPVTSFEDKFFTASNNFGLQFARDIFSVSVFREYGFYQFSSAYKFNSSLEAMP